MYDRRSSLIGFRFTSFRLGTAAALRTLDVVRADFRVLLFVFFVFAAFLRPLDDAPVLRAPLRFFATECSSELVSESRTGGDGGQGSAVPYRA
jgi:hypothetical protein